MNADFHRALAVDKHFGYSAYNEKKFIALVVVQHCSGLLQL